MSISRASSTQSSRYAVPHPIDVADDWRLERLAAAGAAESGAGQLHPRRRPRAGIQLHRRDHRDIAGRRDAHGVGPGYPGFLRGVASSGPGEFVDTTSGGQVGRYRPAASETGVLADGFDHLYGVAVSPGGVVVAELGTGRVVRVNGSTIDTVVADLQRPQGICVHDGVLYIVDAGAKELVAFEMKTKVRRTIASGLPVGPPPGVVPKPLKGMPPFSGPQGPFAGIAAAADGTLYVSADGYGSVLALRRPRDGR
jgi:hypothetical protein